VGEGVALRVGSGVREAVGELVGVGDGEGVLLGEGVEDARVSRVVGEGIASMLRWQPDKPVKQIRSITRTGALFSSFMINPPCSAG
jgi:hypothetical protein